MHGRWLVKLGLWGLGAALASLLVACRPKRPATSFIVNDWRLAKALQDAAKEWADNGISIASVVNVQWTGPNAHGVPVRWVPADQIERVCEAAGKAGCVSYTSSGDDFAGMWLREGLTDVELHRVILHELMHALVPEMPHPANPKHDGILNWDPNGDEITTADLDYVCQYTVCENLAGEPM